MSYTVHHCPIAAAPHWYLLEHHKTAESARRRAYNYALDHGGYVCAKDPAGQVIFGTDPAYLVRAIAQGQNRDFICTGVRS